MGREFTFSSMTPMIRLLRPTNALIALFSVWISSWVSHIPLSLPILLGGLAMALLAAAGNVHNDLVDLPIDRINQPKRPLPSGQVSLSGAMILAVTLVSIPLALGLWLDLHSAIPVHVPWLWIYFAVALLLVVYNLRLKGLPLAGNLAVALLCASALVLPLNLKSTSYSQVPWVLSAFAFWITLIRELTKDLEDISGDQQQGLNTLPIFIGEKNCIRLIKGLIYLTYPLLLVPSILGILPWTFSLLCLPLVVLPLIFATNLSHIHRSQTFMKVTMLGGLLSVVISLQI